MAGSGRQRLDRWLFFSRVVKSRTLAARQVEAGHVRVNREKTTQPSHALKVGDVLTITLERRILVLKVLAPGVRRGPASEAQSLYADLTPPPAPAADQALSGEPPRRDKGAGRPEKKERRAFDRLRELD